MSLNWQPLCDVVAEARRFLLTTHMRPDGDGLGSQVALAEALRSRGKTVHLIIPSSFPPRYDFLNPGGEIHEFQPPPTDALQQVDAVIVLDTGTWNQLGRVGEFIRSLDVPKLVIDHHVTQDDLGAVRLVDVRAEATGRLAYDAIRALGVTLTPTSASALFTAVAMDTGWFRHSNTTAATFELAARLIAAGADPEGLYRELFDKNSVGRLKLMGLVLNRLALAASGRIAHSHVLRRDYGATGALPADSEDLVNFTLSVRGVEVGLLLMEQPAGGTKISLRSKGGINVGKLAEQFGGGGHAPAAGAVVAESLPDAQARVLAAVVALLAPSPS